MKKLLSLVIVFALAITMLNTSAFVVNTKATSNEKKVYMAPYSNVKKQGKRGVCWMFATIASAESNLLKKAGYEGIEKNDESIDLSATLAGDDPIDLSEAQAIYTLYNSEKDGNEVAKDYSSNDVYKYQYGEDDENIGFRGAAPIDGAVALSADKGAALESDNPYEPENIDNMANRAKEQYHLNRFNLKFAEQLPEIYEQKNLDLAGDYALDYDVMLDYDIHSEVRNIWKSKIRENGAIYGKYYQCSKAENTIVPGMSSGLDLAGCFYHSWGDDTNYDSVRYQPNYWMFCHRTKKTAWQNHAIAIVGYDDGYSKYNFAQRYIINDNQTLDYDDKIAELKWVKEENGEPVRKNNSIGRKLEFETSEIEKPGYAQYIVPIHDGAWITKQSYDKQGDNGKKFFDGLMYVSYDDPSFVEATSIVVEESIDQILNGEKEYNNTISHSSLKGLPIEDLDNNTQASEVFEIDQDTEIDQVGYWTGKANTITNISVYKDVCGNNKSDSFDPENGELIATINKTDNYVGYHTIKLPSREVVDKGSKVSVVVSQECEGESALMLEVAKVKNNKGGFSETGMKFKSNIGDTFINYGNNDWIDPAKSESIDVGNTTVKLFGNKIWKAIVLDDEEDDNHQYYWNDATKNNITNISKYAGYFFGTNVGLRVNTPEKISSVSVNGRTENVAETRDNCAVVYFSAFDRYLNDVDITLANGETSYLEIKNEEGIPSYYNVEKYIDGDKRTYPKKEGKIFAGWYEDDSCETPYTKSSGIAYAKFIDEDVLDTKFQWRKDDYGAVRFVSSVDNLDYEKAGFIINGSYGDKTITDKKRETTKAYKSIIADGKAIKPSEAFCDSSQLFTTYTIRGLDENVQSSWEVQAFFVTLDGTMVVGEKACNSRSF